MDGMSRELRDFLAREVVGASVQITDDAPLSELGVDSFALMEIVLFIERRWGVVLPVEQLTRENVRSVASLSRCVQAWMPTTPPG